MTKIHLCFLFNFLSSLLILGQNFHFKATFNQKDTSLYLSSSPGDYLSPRAVARKNTQGIAIDLSDFPLTESYLNTLAQHGAILSKSKWLNAVILGVADSSNIDQVRNLPFIREVRLIGQSNLAIARKSADLGDSKLTRFDYGSAANGIKQMNGDYLHEKGYRGSGLLIAVLDAGFANANSLEIFDSLRIENRITATKNIVNDGVTVYSSDSHGTQVLSVLAANLDGKMVGSAPKASYALILTEDVREENPIEEYYWIEGMEYADSLGADVVNSSLGYNTFDFSNFNHSQSDLYTLTVDISTAANLAWEKGIFVFNAAGNEGKGPWEKLLFPGDADKIITVGGVDNMGIKADFSSIGIQNGNLIKPNVAALAVGVGTNSSNGQYPTSNGTSFACPLVCGLATCLKQQHPTLSNDELKHLIEQSASQHSHPDENLGHGIPNFKLASNQLSNVDHLTGNAIGSLFPNPAKKGQDLFLTIAETASAGLLMILNSNGQTLREIPISPIREKTRIPIDVSNLTAGIYLMTIRTEKHFEKLQFVIQ